MTVGIPCDDPYGKRTVLVEAFKRSIGVWWYGLGAGFVPVIQVMMAFNSSG